MEDDIDVVSLWESMWPGVPFSDASAADRKMMLAHAASLADFRKWKRANG